MAPTTPTQFSRKKSNRRFKQRFRGMTSLLYVGNVMMEEVRGANVVLKF